MGDMIRCAKCSTFHYRNDPCPEEWQPEKSPVVNDCDTDPLIIAFVQGAQWWEWYKEGATMWPTDRDTAGRRAEECLKNGTLGKPVQWHDKPA